MDYFYMQMEAMLFTIRQFRRGRLEWLMARTLVWVKRIEGWGCSDCAWTFVPSGPPVGNTMDEMIQTFSAQRDKEFQSHICSRQPSTINPKSKH
jgi:Uri superfamily endonuclease